MAGVTSTGFQIKRQEDILTDMFDSAKTNISATLDDSSASVLGQIFGISSETTALIYEAALAISVQLDINQAEGIWLDRLTKLLLVTRIAPSASTVSLTLNLDDAVTVPAGSTVAVTGNESLQFTTDAAVTNSTGSTDDFTVLATATVNGPNTANAGTVTTIVDTVSGWNTVTNALDATPGRFRETDSELRTRYPTAISGIGKTTPDAIRARLLEITGLERATIFENPTDTTDANGLPPHSFEAVIFDGVTPVVANNTIAQVLWDNHAAGIKIYGTASGTAVDDLGNNQTVNFSRPTVLPIYLEFDVTRDLNTFPANGVAAIQDAVATFGDTNLLTGQDVILSQLCTAVFEVTGLLDITGTRVGIAPSPTQTTNYVVGARELADLDTSRIVVNVA